MSMITRTKERIKKDEGLRLRIYKCSQGKLTIGYGFNLSDNPITTHVAEMLFNDQFNKNLIPTMQFAGDTWNVLSEVRQGVLLNMCYQLGAEKLFGFKQMRSALMELEYDKAADEMIDSLWYQQTPKRAGRLAAEMRLGFEAKE